LEWSEAEQLGAHRVELGIGDGDSGRHPHPLAEERSPRRFGINRQQGSGIDACRDLGPHTGNKRRIGHARARSRVSTARRVGARAANASSAR